LLGSRVGASPAGEGENVECEIPISIRNKLTTRQLWVLGILEAHVGEAGAIGVQEIAAILGATGRAIQHDVQAMRILGVVIGSISSGRNPGYYLPKNAEDAKAAVNRLVTRAVHQLETVKRMVGGAQFAGIMGQISLQLDGGGADQ